MHHTIPVLQDDFPSSFSILMCKSYISCTVIGMEMNHCTKINHLPPAMAIDDDRALLDRVSNFSFHGNLRPPQKWVWPHVLLAPTDPSLETTLTQGRRARATWILHRSATTGRERIQIRSRTIPSSTQLAQNKWTGGPCILTGRSSSKRFAFWM